jgi:hypothetical protein
MALAHLFKLVKFKGVVLAAPGAGVFKEAWAEDFRGKNVYCLYDHDDAGARGEVHVQQRLENIAASMAFLHWPEKLPSGFDVRDWVVNKAIKRRMPKRCWSSLQTHFYNTPRNEMGSETTPVEVGGLVKERKSRYKKAATFEQVAEVFTKWLLLDNLDTLRLCLSVVLSQEVEGDPLWLFLVSPPGGAKSEFLMSTARDDGCMLRSSLTSHALISGFQLTGNRDPSLIPKLAGKTLVVKDFTTILDAPDISEIFSMLRDAYDGKCSKVFGNGVVREYVSRFTVLSGVTPKIYELGVQHHALGERFLKYLTADNLTREGEERIIARAMSNVGREVQMRDELEDVTASFLAGRRKGLKKLPKIAPEMESKLLTLAMFTARLRGTVTRSPFKPDIMEGRPVIELATRLGKQFKKLAVSLALAGERDDVDESDYQLVSKTALDTVPQRREDIVRAMYRECPDPNDTMRTRDVAIQTHYPLSTAARMLDDLMVLGVVDRVGKRNLYEWTLAPVVREQIARVGFYREGETLARPHRKVFKRLRKRRKARARRLRGPSPATA